MPHHSSLAEQNGKNPLTGGYWCHAHDADARVVALYERHYSADPKKRGSHRSGISGPSERMVLLTSDGRSVYVWRRMKPPKEWVSSLVRPDLRRRRKGLALGEKTSTYFAGQYCVMCSIFRNEGLVLSSLLIEEACELAWKRWPNQRLFTYAGRNKDGRLTILERFPQHGEPG